MNNCFKYPRNASLGPAATFGVDYTVSANCTDTLVGEGFTCKCLAGFLIDSAQGRSCTAEEASILCPASPCDKNTTTCVSDILLPYGEPRAGMDPNCKVAFPYCCDCKYPKNQTRIKYAPQGIPYAARSLFLTLCNLQRHPLLLAQAVLIEPCLFSRCIHCVLAGASSCCVCWEILLK